MMQKFWVFQWDDLNFHGNLMTSIKQFLKVTHFQQPSCRKWFQKLLSTVSSGQHSHPQS